MAAIKINMHLNAVEEGIVHFREDERPFKLTFLACQVIWEQWVGAQLHTEPKKPQRFDKKGASIGQHLCRILAPTPNFCCCTNLYTGVFGIKPTSSHAIHKTHSSRERSSGPCPEASLPLSLPLSLPGWY